MINDHKRKVKLSVVGLFKIFGPRSLAMMELVRGGVSKKELLEKHGHVLGLQDINVDLNGGQITVIMGLSGSGKSTLIRHFNRLIEPTEGSIFLDGEDILSIAEHELLNLRRKRMSMVFQKFALFPHRTVEENATLAMSVRGDDEEQKVQESKKWLNRLGLQGFENHYPHQLSGGMQQRVGIARALCAHSEIMLLDEAFSALDPIIRSQMQDLLLELQSEIQKTIVFITHDLDEALKLADHLVILKDGYIIQQDEPQKILLNPKDPYIERFVSDINRARVLRARSIMTESTRIDSSLSDSLMIEIDHNDTLEAIIGRVQGDISKSFKVMKNGLLAGYLDMHQVMRALVPRVDGQDVKGMH